MAKIKTWNEKKDQYLIVQNTILKQLKLGNIPWQMPTMAKVGSPQNFETKNKYKGSNQILLSMLGYGTPYFLTYIQAKKLGGICKAGTGQKAIKYKITKVLKPDAKNKPKTSLTSDDYNNIPIINTFTLYNISEIEGIDIPENEPPKENHKQWEMGENIIKNIPNCPKLVIAKYKTNFYNIKTDTIFIGAKQSFQNPQHYYRELFKLIAQATFHEKRLNNKKFQTKMIPFSYQELVCELTAAYISGQAGIVVDNFKNQTGYIQVWSKTLSEENHKKWFTSACKLAQTSAEYMQGISFKFL